MMGIAVITLHCFVALSYAKELVTIHNANMQDSRDTVVNALFDRICTAWPFQHTNLDNSMFGKRAPSIMVQRQLVPQITHAPPSARAPFPFLASSSASGYRLRRGAATPWHLAPVIRATKRQTIMSEFGSAPPLEEIKWSNRSRRDLHVLVGWSALLNLPIARHAAATPALATSWSATDGFSDQSFISFDESAYNSMRDDERRTPLFKKAIQQRLARAPAGTITMLDLGTGPEAIFALAAARAGAKMVYAIEANREAAKRARKAIENAKDIVPGTVKLIEGFSTDITLPEKVDFIVAEIAGSVASEEGAYATIRDAQARFVKQPADPNSYIPYSLQTFGAPASYALHYVYGPPEYDWGKLKGEPVRLNCRDTRLELLADPLLMEEIRFADLALPASGKVNTGSTLAWRIDPKRVSANEKLFYDELLKVNVPQAEAGSLARNIAQSMSGIALWPRLVLDAEGTLVVESRGPNGEPQKSHWQTVLPILSTRPVSIEPGATARIAFEVDLQDGNVKSPLRYSLTGDIA